MIKAILSDGEYTQKIKNLYGCTLLKTNKGIQIDGYQFEKAKVHIESVKEKILKL
jgi:hypothetical protein